MTCDIQLAQAFSVFTHKVTLVARFTSNDVGTQELYSDEDEMINAQQSYITVKCRWLQEEKYQCEEALLFTLVYHFFTSRAIGLHMSENHPLSHGKCS